jgi:hypothetical protein
MNASRGSSVPKPSPSSPASENVPASSAPESQSSAQQTVATGTAAATTTTTISNSEAEAILTGKTLDVYKYLLLKLSSPGVATFHLDKLQRSGLISKNPSDGSFTISKIYLKHYFLLRSYLVPRYFLYAALFTVLSLGWTVALYLGLGKTGIISSAASSAVFYVFIYGLVCTILAAAVFWFESLRVMRREII